MKIKNTVDFLLCMLCMQIFIFNVNAQSRSNEEIGRSYFQAANDSLRMNDLQGSCNNITEAYRYFELANREGALYPPEKRVSNEMLAKIRTAKNNTCAIAVQNAPKSVAQTFIEASQKADYCRTLNEISQSCAAAGSYDQCMKIRANKNYKEGFSYCNIR